MPISPTDLASLSLLAGGVVLGALGFSLVVGRHRARQLARLADRLARATGDVPPAASIRYPDPVLTRSLERLASRIARVEAMASTDVLTGLTNRQACVRVLASEIDRANRYGRPLSVALLDVDHFKRANDTYGHAVGDRLLSHVAGLLRANVRSVDTLGRYGGEEFLLIMPETDLDAGAAAAENLRRLVGRSMLELEGTSPLEGTSQLEGENQPELGSMTVTISAGVAGGAGSTSLDVDVLLREADAALYTAKSLGRDRVQVFRPTDDEAQVFRVPIDANARSQAIDIGRAAFDAAHEELHRALGDRPVWAGGPSKLIANLASDLARAVGLPDGDVGRIRTASLLHDLGKLAIPHDVLAKPSTLTEHEWRAIVEHPKIGQLMLEQAGAMRDAASIVLHHHEWFNGRGYPFGLAGTEIPLGSRIVAIADAYDAMISGRPYKPPISHEEAIVELRRQGGVQFDPELVETFVSLNARGISPNGSRRRTARPARA